MTTDTMIFFYFFVNLLCCAKVTFSMDLFKTFFSTSAKGDLVRNVTDLEQQNEVDQSEDSYSDIISDERLLQILKTRDPHCDLRTSYPLDQPLIYLTVSPRGRVSWSSRVDKRHLIVNWVAPKDVQQGDWVGLMHGEVFLDTDVNVESALAYQALSFGMEQGHGQLLTKAVLPYEQRHLKVMIPGSHDSGSIKRFVGFFAENILNRYSVNQDETVWNQLIHGVRYLDIRVGFHSDGFYSVHGPVTFNSLKVLLREVKSFIEHTHEIVVLNFHRFLPDDVSEEEDEKRHLELQKFLTKTLGMQLFPRGENGTIAHLTLEALWKARKRILITYNHKTFIKNPILWPGAQVLWNRSCTTPKKLFVYLNKTLPAFESTNKLISINAHLSFGEKTVLRDVFPLDLFGVWDNGIRKMTEILSRHLDHWFRNIWWTEANLVATDFVLANNIVQEARKANYRRFVCAHQKDVRSKLRTFITDLKTFSKELSKLKMDDETVK